MSTKRRKRPLAENRRLTQAARTLAQQKTEIRKLKEKLRKMKDKQVELLQAIAGWKEVMTRVRARLDQVDKLVVQLLGAPTPQAAGQNIKAHRTRTTLLPRGRHQS